jgi:hypothetical protein
VVNPTEVEQALTLKVNGVNVAGKVKRWTLSGTSTMARNRIGKEAEVSVKQTVLDVSESIVVEPASINIYRYEYLTQ